MADDTNDNVPFIFVGPPHIELNIGRYQRQRSIRNGFISCCNAVHRMLLLTNYDIDIVPVKMYVSLQHTSLTWSLHYLTYLDQLGIV